MKCNIPANDLSQKLNHTVCMYDGQPVYVAIDHTTILITPLPKKNDFKQIKANDPLFDISSPPLGYVQVTPEQVMYLRRVPIRRSVQGLNARSLAISSLPNSRVTGWSAKSVAGDIFFSQVFVDMVNNDFPPLENSLKKVRGMFEKDSSKSYEVAINRDIAISIHEVTGVINVFYKNSLVGWIPPNEFIVEVQSDEKGWIISKYLSNVLGWTIN